MYEFDVVTLMKNLDDFALKNTTDPKVFVGCALGRINNVGEFWLGAIGCNQNIFYNERVKGKTYRQLLFNSRDPKYRPWDRIIHAEENAVLDSMRNETSESCNVAVVTRYPCEKCAQLLIYKGIKKVYYGRSTLISDTTKKMFEDAGVEVIHVEEYDLDESLPWISEYDRQIKEFNKMLEIKNIKNI